MARSGIETVITAMNPNLPMYRIRYSPEERLGVYMGIWNVTEEESEIDGEMKLSDATVVMLSCVSDNGDPPSAPITAQTLLNTKICKLARFERMKTTQDGGSMLLDIYERMQQPHINRCGTEITNKKSSISYNPESHSSVVTNKMRDPGTLQAIPITQTDDVASLVVPLATLTRDFVVYTSPSLPKEHIAVSYTNSKYNNINRHNGMSKEGTLLDAVVQWHTWIISNH